MNGNAEKESCNDDFSLILTLRQTDPFYEKKKKLLHARGFNPEVQVLFTRLSASLNDTLKALVEAARIIHLDEDELYFAGVNANHPENFYSPRNELEALNSILSLINISLNNATHKKMDILEILRDATLDMIREFGEQNGEELLIEKRACLAEDLLLQWAKDRGLKTKLQIAYVNGAGRGALAVNDLKVGDTALEIPVSIIISEEVVYESEMVAMGLEDVRVHISFYWRHACSASIDIHLRQKINTLNPLKNIVLKIKSGFHILKELDSLTPETMLLLWSMMERYNSESKFKIFFETLPETFNTGLSFGIEALTALEGTLLFEEIIQAKEHLRMQYDALCPLLCNKHPDMFQPDLYTWDRFLWACELWYSNSMKVVFPDGKLKTCLVPVAGFLNHSLCPHIIRYGRVDSASRALKFSLSRPCREGEQCYLSYGNFSSSHLITFYGFMPKGENIYDVIPLDIDAPQTDDFGNRHESEWTVHMVRGTWLSSNHELFNYGLPPPLLNYLRATLNDSKMPTETFVDTEDEMAVLETLCSIFNPMLEGLGVSVNGQRENLEWDVKLAVDFKDLQRRIISSVLASCSAGLEMLQCLELKETMNAAATTSEDS